MFDKIKDQAAQSLGSAKAALGGLSEKSTALVSSGLEEINSLRPVLQKAGFIIGDVKIGIGLSPRIGVIIEQTEGGKFSLQEVYDQLDAPTATQKAVLNALISIYKLEDDVNQRGYTVGQIEIEMALPPLVTVHLNSKDSRAFTSS